MSTRPIRKKFVTTLHTKAKRQRQLHKLEVQLEQEITDLLKHQQLEASQQVIVSETCQGDTSLSCITSIVEVSFDTEEQAYGLKSAIASRIEMIVIVELFRAVEHTVVVEDITSPRPAQPAA